jgi:hypothetical protein
MLFGLTNAPAHFMYLMNLVFMEELDRFVMIFSLMTSWSFLRVVDYIPCVGTAGYHKVL